MLYKSKDDEIKHLKKELAEAMKAIGELQLLAIKKQKENEQARTDAWNMMERWSDTKFKLDEYKQAEEQGLLIKLPCSVGNTVYIVFNEYGELFIQEGWAVTEITITGDDILFDFECFQTEESESRNIDSFGKTVFLTREAAEEALKGGSL